MTAHAAGWNVENQRPTDGHTTVAGVLRASQNAEDAEDSSGQMGKAGQSGRAEQASQGYAPVAQSEDGDTISLAQGQWDLNFGLDNQLFPAAIIGLSTLNPENIGVVPSENSFGSPLGMASVYILAQHAGDKVTVEISSTKLIHPSRMTVVLPDTDNIYEISPHLKYEYEKLLSIRQPYPEDVTAKVYVNGREVGEKTRTVIVRSVNDCFYGMVTNNGQNFQDWSEMFAAYVNEGDPVIEDILGEALRKGYVDSFIGYQGNEDDVLRQINAIWRVLQDRGVRYCNITTTSVESDKVAAQHVRLVGDSTRGGQANCVDGSVLFASVFRKIGLDAYLVLLPGHMMVAVSLDGSEDAPVMGIETTMVADASLDQALDSAVQTLSQVEHSANGESDIIYISVNKARSAGILPLRNLRRR